MKIKCFIILIFLIITAHPAWSQPDSVRQTEIVERLHSLAKNAAPELAYIQTSKDIYETGEDLWFKVYILNSQTFIPSDLSKTLYLQLLNETSKKAVWQEKYEIINGFANGRVYIDSNLPEGDYLLAAYTSNSFFSDTANFYAVRKIKVKTDITKRPSIRAEFDRPYYNNNDTIRLKVSILSQQIDFPEAEITASLLNRNKKQVKVKCSADINGESVISFPFQDSKEKQIEISFKSKDLNEKMFIQVPIKNNSLQFSVFPEGGYLVSGIRSKLAFKAVNNLGQPVDIKGTVFEDNKPLLEFKSRHAGMGSFAFNPDKMKKYFIRLSEPLTDSTFNLPEILPSGIAMQLIGRDKETLTFKVSQSPDLMPDDIILRIQCRGMVYGITTAKLTKEIGIKVPLSGLPQGIAEITLFNSNLVPVAERLVYINNDQRLNIITNISEEINHTRGKAILKISVKDEKGYPVSANLGVSVFAKSYKNPGGSSDMLAHYFLSTQLQGKIFNPSFYFNPGNKGCEEGLDLLMLTQGWRKYIWNETKFKKSDPENYRILEDGVKAKLTLSRRGEKNFPSQLFVVASSPNRDTTSVLFTADSSKQIYVSPYYFKLWEDDYVYLKPMAPSGYNLRIKLTDSFDAINQAMCNKEIVCPAFADIIEKVKDPDFSLSRAGIINIKSVTIKSNPSRAKFLNKLDSLLKDENDDYVCKFNILNCPRHIKEPGYKKPVDGMRYFVLLNYGTNSESLSSVIYNSKRPRSSKNNLTDEELLEMYNMIRVKAYYGSREFYKPDYDKISDEALIPDYRNTLLWEPSVLTDENGNATLTFFCSDLNTDFVGIIEGVSGSGLLGSGSFKFTVRKLKITP